MRNILRIKYRLGLFENPYVDEKANVLYAPSHLEAAKQAATESAILLKNDRENASATIFCKNNRHSRSNGKRTIRPVGHLGI